MVYPRGHKFVVFAAWSESGVRNMVIIETRTPMIMEKIARIWQNRCMYVLLEDNRKFLVVNLKTDLGTDYPRSLKRYLKFDDVDTAMMALRML